MSCSHISIALFHKNGMICKANKADFMNITVKETSYAHDDSTETNVDDFSLCDVKKNP